MEHGKALFWIKWKSFYPLSEIARTATIMYSEDRHPNHGVPGDQTAHILLAQSFSVLWPLRKHHIPLREIMLWNYHLIIIIIISPDIRSRVVHNDLLLYGECESKFGEDRARFSNGSCSVATWLVPEVCWMILRSFHENGNSEELPRRGHA